MGQQQLLLLVLGVVIVGMATVVGIQAFSENQKKANADALVNDAIRVASDAQAWRLKPKAFGGGADNAASTPWAGLTVKQLGYPVTSAGNYSNLNGEIATSISGTTLTITATSAASGNQVTVTVTGTTPDDISTSVDTDYTPSS